MDVCSGDDVCGTDSRKLEVGLKSKSVYENDLNINKQFKEADKPIHRYM
jgi:hypothetical protein